MHVPINHEKHIHIQPQTISHHGGHGNGLGGNGFSGNGLGGAVLLVNGKNLNLHSIKTFFLCFNLQLHPEGKPPKKSNDGGQGVKCRSSPDRRRWIFPEVFPPEAVGDVY